MTTVNCGPSPPSASLACTVEYTPPANASVQVYTVPVHCGSLTDSLSLLSSETSVEIRAYSDMTVGATCVFMIPQVQDTYLHVL